VARRAPAVERSVAVLNFLAAHAGERFTLSDLARDLRINKATLHALLSAMTEAGYLVRDDSRKTYGLGPAVIAVGNAAVGAYPAVDLAMPEMLAMREELGLDSVASAAIHDEIVILARAGTPAPFDINIQPGHRLPLAPPLGTVFIAWSGQEKIDRWLGKVGPSASQENLKRYRHAVETVRARGYSVGLEGDEQQRLVEALGHAAHEAGPSVEESVRGLTTQEYALIELDRAAAYRLNHIGAPVFGSDGEVTIGLFLIGFQDQIPAERVPRYAERLLTAAERVTKAIHGREPERN
jgi:DNA-binding IclR family transcriptional regulator